MRKFLTYGLVILGGMLLGQNLAFGQEREKMKSLKELRQLEKGYVEVDEIEPFLLKDLPVVPDVLILSYQGNTNIQLRKKMEGIDSSRKYYFNVEEDYSGINFFIMGKITEGSFNIKITKPDKTVLKEMNISSGKDDIWQQSYILDKVKKTGIGKWTVEISCRNASGYYQFVSSSR